MIILLPKGTRAGVAELADARDLKSREVTLVPVRPRPPAPNIAEWSSPVARRAHNPEVGGSNPPSATRKEKITHRVVFFLSLIMERGVETSAGGLTRGKFFDCCCGRSCAP